MNSFLWKCERECQVGNVHDAACRDSSISLFVCVCVWLSIRQQQQQLLHCCTVVVVVVCLPVWLAVWQMPTLLGILQFARQMCPQSICVASGKRNAERKAQCCHCCHCGCCLCSCCCCCCCLCFCLCFLSLHLAELIGHYARIFLWFHFAQWNAMPRVQMSTDWLGVSMYVWVSLPRCSRQTEWEAATVTALSSLSASACALTVQRERISLRLPDSAGLKYCAMFTVFAFYT